MSDTFQRGQDERDHVDSSWIDDCDKQFIGMTPDDVREHIVEDHDEPLGERVVFPTDEARDRYGQGPDSEGVPDS